MSGFQCPVCANSFSNRSAVCEDWRIPEKSFGCPHCQSFFRVEGTTAYWSDYLFPAAALLLMVVEYFDLPTSGTIATPLLLGIGGFGSLYFMWKRRRTPAYRLVPVVDGSIVK